MSTFIYEENELILTFKSITFILNSLVRMPLNDNALTATKFLYVAMSGEIIRSLRRPYGE